MFRFINDNGHYNLHVVPYPYKGHWQMAIITTKAIKKNQELSYNYGSVYWQVY